MKPLAVLLAGLCLSAGALGQSLTLNQLYAFSCGASPPYFCANGAKPAALIQGLGRKLLRSHGNQLCIAR